MGEHLFEVQTNEWSHIGIDIFVVLGFLTISKVDLFIGEVINNNLQVAGVQTRNDLSNCELSCNVTMILSQHFMKSLMVGRTKPIHAIVNCIFNRLMPIFLGKRIFIINNITNRVTVLETPEFAFPISHS